MSKKYKSPGIYVKEIPSLPPEMTSVKTSIPAFVGYTEKAEKNGASLLLQPTRISSMLEFEALFGGKNQIQNFTVVVDEANNFEVLEIEILNTQHYFLHESVRLFFNNGGRNCFIVSVGFYGTAPAYGDEADPLNIGLRNGVKALESFDAPTLILFPDAVNVVNNGTDDPGFYSLQQMALQQCGNLEDRFCILDLKENIKEDHSVAIDNFRNNIGTSHLKFGAAYSPFLISSHPFELNLTSFKDAIYTFGREPVTLQELSASSVDAALVNTYFDAGDDVSRKAAQEDIYRDHSVISKIVKGISRKVCTIPPSGAIAGIYTMVDRNRGVWKAPANVSINSISSLSVTISSQMQESMNVDPNGKSINAIRFFTGKGILVWGARTLAGNDHEWKYVSVRRLFNMVQESVKKALSQFIFEPNDGNTWVRVNLMIENFLTGLWRMGALMGVTPHKAYFVKVGLGKTMTAQDILEGRMIIEIGLAAVRPAEFIIIRISQQMSQA